MIFGRQVFSFGETSSGNITLVNEHSNRKMEGLKMYFLLTSINNGDFPLLLLMEEILHHLGCIKPYEILGWSSSLVVQEFVHQQYMLVYQRVRLLDSNFHLLGSWYRKLRGFWYMIPVPSPRRLDLLQHQRSPTNQWTWVSLKNILKKTFENCLPYKPPPPKKKGWKWKLGKTHSPPIFVRNLFLIGNSLGFMASQPTSPPNIPKKNMNLMIRAYENSTLVSLM